MNYRAPREHAAILAEPPLDRAGEVVESNRRIFEQSTLQLFDRPLADLRRQAQSDLSASARDYLRQCGEPIPQTGSAECLFLAGHQPDLFHPGVWFKNFALARLARNEQATAVNLVIDSDTIKTTSVKLPVHADDAKLVRPASVAFDRGSVELPYEERRVLDEAEFRSFPERVSERTGTWNFQPMLAGFWQEALRASPRTKLLGERISAARRTYERRWGCHNFEVPWHAVCRSQTFAWFACALLSDLPRLHAIYNESVRAYRRQHGIRSRSHPVPDLAADGEWLEAPLWVWRAEVGKRCRLFVRNEGTALALRLEAEAGPRLPIGKALIAAWPTLETQGFKVRSRALITTLFARLFLGDLFVHGIGGAKYDELTDAIVRRYYEMEPPRFLVLSATLLLPFPLFRDGADTCADLARHIRDLTWNPQRHLAAHASPDADRWSREKQEWIARQPGNAAARKDRFDALQDLTRRLRPFVAGQQQELAQALTRCRHAAQANSILQHRDYAFCLYPKDMLRDFYRQ